MSSSRFESTLFEKARTAARLLGEVAAELDGDVLDLEGAKTLVDVFTRCERFAVAGRGVAARRVATVVNWKHAGHRNPAEWLVSTAGVSVGEASRELETARRLEGLPATSVAFRAGEISEAQAGEIAASASVDPEAEGALLDTARSGASFRAVRDQCRETSMRAADDAAQARRAARHSQRPHLSRGRRASGDVRRVRARHRCARELGGRAGHRRPLPRRACRGHHRVEVRVRRRRDRLPDPRRASGSRARRAPPLDAAAVERGWAEPGERCDLDGVGPVPVTLARAMLQDARVTLLRHDEHGDITHLSSPTRTIPVRLRRWVEEAFPLCGRSGCHRRFRLEIDHITPLAEGGATEKANLWRLCGHDHHLKTYRRWKVVRLADDSFDLGPPHGHPPRDDRPGRAPPVNE